MLRVHAWLRALLHTQHSWLKDYIGYLGICLLFYLYRLTHFLVSIDDELAWARKDPAVWLEQGRWTTYWLEKFVLPQPTLPYVPDALFCCLLTFSYLLLLRSHRFDSSWKTRLLFPLFCASPVLMVLGEFYANLLTTGLGYVTTALAACALRAGWETSCKIRKVAFFVAQCLLLAVGVGCYQSFLLLYCACATGMWLKDLTDAHVHTFASALRRGVYLTSAIAAGMGVYTSANSLHLARYVARSAGEVYLDSFLHPQAVRAPLGDIVAQTFAHASMIYGGAAERYGQSLHALAGIVILASIAAVHSMLRASWLLALAQAAGFIALVTAPFGLDLVSGGTLPLRTYVGVPYVLWALGSSVLNHKTASLRVLGSAATLAACLQIFVTNGEYAAAMEITQAADRTLAAQLYHAVGQSRPDFHDNASYAIDIYGRIVPELSPYRSAWSSTTEGSFFFWDGGNPGRIVQYMRLLGYSNLREVNAEERAAVSSIWDTMPCWPNPGSVTWRGTTALVKLGRDPGYAHPQL